MRVCEINPEFTQIILELSTYVCVVKIAQRHEKEALLIAPFSSKGRMVQEGEIVSYTADDIRVLHRIMYLWPQDGEWSLELSSQMHQTKSYKNRSEALDIIKTEIEEYWTKNNVPGA